MHPWSSCILVAGVLTVGLAAQCAKPLVPVGGLPTRRVLDRTYTYSDGYRTKVNLVYPSGAVPSCKWPLVVDIHGLGYKRLNNDDIAQHGYAVVSYDVRGQGDARTMNPPTKGLDFYGANEKYDLAEIVAFARGRWKSLINPSRLAVVGGSQGGIHAWFAAAYSGQKLKVAGRGTITFPRVTAAVPQDFVPDPMLSTHPNDGTQWSMMYLNFLFAPVPPSAYQPQHVDDLRRFFLNQDPVGHRLHLLAQPGRAVVPLLQRTTVPILFTCAYYDELNAAREYTRILRQINNKHIHGIVSTIGHGSADNAVEGSLRREARNLWLDHYLWQVSNHAPDLARWDFGVVPASTAAYENAGTLWAHRREAAATPPSLVHEKMWLTDRGSLVHGEPASGVPTRIVHKVKGSFTPALFRSSPWQRLLPQVLAAIPMSERVFRYPPLTGDIELAGQARLSLAVNPDAERFVISGLLRARLPGETGTFMLSHWGRGVIGARPGVPSRLEFDLAPSFILLPRGSVIELVIRNHWVQEAPMDDALVAAPYFEDCTVRVEHGRGARASWVTIPRRLYPGVDLVSSVTTLDVRSPGRFEMRVRGHATRAGKTALTLGSLSGTAPGIAFGGVTIPLVPDATMTALIDMIGTGYLNNFMTALDKNGEATLAVNFHTMGKLPIELIGHRLSFATFVLEQPTAFIGTASNPLGLFLK